MLCYRVWINSIVSPSLFSFSPVLLSALFRLSFASLCSALTGWGAKGAETSGGWARGFWYSVTAIFAAAPWSLNYWPRRAAPLVEWYPGVTSTAPSGWQRKTEPANIPQTRAHECSRSLSPGTGKEKMREMNHRKRNSVYRDVRLFQKIQRSD